MPVTAIVNPILPGFNPDPSLVRVGDDYFIATRTFEWFSGVQIHHSRDLVHWRLIGHALTRTSQFDRSGAVDSGGVCSSPTTTGHGLHLTGAFVGLCAQDVGGTRVLADFDDFALRNHARNPDWVPSAAPPKWFPSPITLTSRSTCASSSG